MNDQKRRLTSTKIPNRCLKTNNNVTRDTRRISLKGNSFNNPKTQITFDHTGVQPLRIKECQRINLLLVLNAIHVARQTEREVSVPKIEAKETERMGSVLNSKTEGIVSVPQPQSK